MENNQFFLKTKFRKGIILVFLILWWFPISYVDENPNLSSSSITFAVIGDYGSGSVNELAVAGMIEGWNPDFILTTGDDYYSSAGGLGTGKYDISTGKYYCGFLKGAVEGTFCPSGGTADINSFFPSSGNHDYSDSGISFYTSYFNLPGADFSSSSGNERYYDFVWGPVQFFAINSNSQEPDGNTSSSSQAEWLESQLEVSTSSWQIVFFHHAPYSSGSHGNSNWMQWPFADWGADVVLTGHDHTYERVLRDGIPYFVNGVGGKSLYSFGATVNGSQYRYNDNFGAMRVTASKHILTFEFLSVDEGGTLRDKYQLTKDLPIETFIPLLIK